MGKLADWIARRLWWWMLWLMRRPRIRWMQRWPERRFTGERLERWRRSYISQERFARRYGLAIVRTAILMLLASVLITLTFKLMLEVKNAGYLDRPQINQQ